MTLNQYLRETGETYSSIARKAGLSPDAVRMVALGLRYPRLKTAIAISKGTDQNVPVTFWYPQAEAA